MIYDIRLQKFRSYSDSSFEFNPGVNIIVGPNASGKTNLLEAILLICGGRSYRAKDAELVMYKQSWARLDADAPTGQRSLKFIKRRDTSIEQQLSVNKQLVKRLTSSKKIPTVLFEPNHLQLFRDGPEQRRDYLDNLLEQLYPAYIPLRRQYRRTLAQRNRLLKLQPAEVTKQLFVWNVRLSELGGQVVEYRQQLVKSFNKQLPKLYAAISGDKTRVKATYYSILSSTQYSSALLHKLEASVAQDLQVGFTTYGPHRDDMHILFNDHLAQDTASRGEIRTLLLVLKIIELQLIEEAFDAKPLLLLDDVFSELDGARRRALTKAITGYQTFITTTDADAVLQHFTQQASLIPLSLKK